MYLLEGLDDDLAANVAGAQGSIDFKLEHCEVGLLILTRSDLEVDKDNLLVLDVRLLDGFALESTTDA